MGGAREPRNEALDGKRIAIRTHRRWVMNWIKDQPWHDRKVVILQGQSARTPSVSLRSACVRL